MLGNLKVADEVWLAAALLHTEQPHRDDFSVDEILVRASETGVTNKQRPGVRVHILQHCVANRPPNPGRYRMLYETAPGRRRLYRAGDPYNPARENSKVTPMANDLPPQYRPLLDWYEHWSGSGTSQRFQKLFSLIGSGRHLWRNAQTADAYVADLREGWE